VAKAIGVSPRSRCRRWRAVGGSKTTGLRSRFRVAKWCGQPFLRLPEDLPAPLVDQAREAARPSNLAASRVPLVTFTEGLCVQAMHNGPYAEEPAMLGKMDEHMSAHDLEPNGLHHEIYLSDLNETDPARMHTILRQPVRSKHPRWA
jgi:hypothetical protein